MCVKQTKHTKRKLSTTTSSTWCVSEMMLWSKMKSLTNAYDVRVAEDRVVEREAEDAEDHDDASVVPVPVYAPRWIRASPGDVDDDTPGGTAKIERLDAADVADGMPGGLLDEAAATATTTTEEETGSRGSSRRVARDTASSPYTPSSSSYSRDDNPFADRLRRDASLVMRNNRSPSGSGRTRDGPSWSTYDSPWSSGSSDEQFFSPATTVTKPSRRDGGSDTQVIQKRHSRARRRRKQSVPVRVRVRERSPPPLPHRSGRIYCHFQQRFHWSENIEHRSPWVRHRAKEIFNYVNSKGLFETRDRETLSNDSKKLSQRSTSDTACDDPDEPCGNITYEVANKFCETLKKHNNNNHNNNKNGLLESQCPSSEHLKWTKLFHELIKYGEL